MSDDPKKGRPSSRDLLLQAARAEGIELAVNKHDRAVIRAGGNGHFECLYLDSKKCKRWLRAVAFRHGVTPTRNAIEEAVLTLESAAYTGGKTVETCIRVGRGRDDATARDGRDDGRVLLDPLNAAPICIDLGTSDHSYIEVTGSGWSVKPSSLSSPWFIRPAGMLPLPLPVRGGDINELWQFLNVNGEPERMLVLATAVHSFLPGVPCPVLILIGEQGTGKSTFLRIYRGLIDPHVAGLSTAPRNPEDIFVLGEAMRIIGLDNLSSLPPELADVLCMVATGAAKAGRELYTNGDISILQARNPIILNSISDGIASRGDLVDRAVLISPAVIPANERLTEADLSTALEEAAPRLFGALLDRVDATLFTPSSVNNEKREEKRRMADYDQTGEALAMSMGYAPGWFHSVYVENGKAANDTTLDASPVAVALVRLLQERGPQSGSPSTLLAALNQYGDSHSPYWPKTPASLSSAVKRLAPALRTAGYQVAIGHGHAGRFIDVQQYTTVVAPVAGRRVVAGNTCADCAGRASGFCTQVDRVSACKDFSAGEPPPFDSSGGSN